MDSKHVCKFCRKSFPCGRSLGGHIRSHLIHNSNINSANAASKEEPKLPKLGSEPGYELRENPKKTNKATDLSFMSSSPSSWSTKSDNEYGSDPNPAKRSSFHGGNNSNSSISEVVEPEQEEVAVAMSLIMLSRDVGKKSEDVSSKNVSLRQAKSRGKRRRREKIQEKCSVSGADSKKYIKKSEILGVSASGFLQNGSKEKESEVSEIGFFSSDQSNKPLESKNSVSGAADGSAKRKEKIELAAPGQIQNGSKLKEFEVIQNGFGSNDQITKPAERKRKINDPNSMTHKLGSSASGSVKNRSKMKEIEVSENGSASNDEKNNQTELALDDIAMSSELLSNNDNYKRSKFECTTCNKIFYSYQALGGHRASHKKLISIKPSPHSKLEWNDKDFLSPPPLPTDNHHQQQQFGEIGIGSSSSTSTPIKAVQKHECPICFRIFPSGQALGGHKRSHMLSANTSSNDINKDIDVIERSSSSETREFLDLNLPPASGEQEATIPTSSSSNNLVGLIKPHWWVEGTNKHQLLLGLISN